jgi:hypothetical protein
MERRFSFFIVIRTRDDVLLQKKLRAKLDVSGFIQV